jgi:hypothetical protein
MSPALFDYLIFIRALLTTFETLIGKGGTKIGREAEDCDLNGCF